MFDNEGLLPEVNSMKEGEKVRINFNSCVYTGVVCHINGKTRKELKAPPYAFISKGNKPIPSTKICLNGNKEKTLEKSFKLVIIFPIQVNFSEPSRKYGPAGTTKMGNILVSEATLKEERGACLHKLFQGLWMGLCDAQEGVWVMLSDLLTLQ